MTTGIAYAVIRDLAIVVDADLDAAGTFGSMQKACREAGLPEPEHPATWQPGDFGGQEVRVRIDVLPPQGNGTIDDMILAGEPPETLQCVEEFLRCSAPLHGPAAKCITKAKLQALAATRL